MANKSLKNNAAYNFIKAFLNLAFPILSFPYASRILMPAGIGKVNFINSFVDYFVLLAELGIGTYAAREAARLRDNKAELNRFCQQILTINFASTLFAYGALVFSFCISTKLQDYRVLLAVTSTKILFAAIGVNWLFLAEEEFRYVTTRSASFQVFSLIFLFTFIKKPEDYVLYALMGIISNVGSNLCNIFYARKFITIRFTKDVQIRKHIRPILVFFGMSCATEIHGALDTVMLGFMLNDNAVGYYSAAQKMKNLVTKMITSIIVTLMPRSSWYLEHNDERGYQQIVQKAGNVACFFSIPAAFGIATIARPLIILFSGDSYLPALPSMLILTPSIITISLVSFLSSVILTPQRLERFSLQAQVLGSALNLLLNSLLIPIWGVLGASLATLIVECTIMAIMMFHARKFLKGSKLVSSFLQALAGSLCMALVVSFVISRLDNIFLKTIVGTLTGAFTYASIMVAMKNQSAKMIASMILGRLHRN